MLTQWRGKDILDPKHAEHLDRHAAELEFGQNMPRQDAEEKAYKSYRVKNYIEAAAHHWKAFTAASAVADPSSKEHKMMYDVYMRALGHNPAGPVPPEVKQVIPDINQKRVKFMAHAADQLPLLRSELNQILPLAKLLVDVVKLSKGQDKSAPIAVGAKVRLTPNFLASTGQAKGADGSKTWTVQQCDCDMCGRAGHVAVSERRDSPQQMAGYQGDSEYQEYVKKHPYRHINVKNLKRV